MATFVIGSLLQLTLSVVDYSFLMGALSLAPTPAFIINTALMATFSFLFMRWVTFRAKLASKSRSDGGASSGLNDAAKS